MSENWLQNVIKEEPVEGAESIVIPRAIPKVEFSCKDESLIRLDFPATSLVDTLQMPVVGHNQNLPSLTPQTIPEIDIFEVTEIIPFTESHNVPIIETLGISQNMPISTEGTSNMPVHKTVPAVEVAQYTPDERLNTLAHNLNVVSPLGRHLPQTQTLERLTAEPNSCRRKSERIENQNAVIVKIEEESYFEELEMDNEDMTSEMLIKTEQCDVHSYEPDIRESDVVLIPQLISKTEPLPLDNNPPLLNAEKQKGGQKCQRQKNPQLDKDQKQSQSKTGNTAVSIKNAAVSIRLSRDINPAKIPLDLGLFASERPLSNTEKRRLWRERQQQNNSITAKDAPLTTAERRQRYLERRRLKELLGIVEPKDTHKRTAKRKTRRQHEPMDKLDTVQQAGCSPTLTSSFKDALNTLQLMRNDQDTTIPTDPSTQQNILNESDKSVPVAFPTGQSHMFNVCDSQRNSRQSMSSETDLVEELVEVSEISRKSILNTTTVGHDRQADHLEIRPDLRLGPVISDALIEEGNLSRLEKRRLWRERQRQNTEGNENVTIEPSSNGKEPPLTNAERRKRFLERRRLKELLGIVEPKPQSSKRGATRRTRNPDSVQQFDNNKSLQLRVSADSQTVLSRDSMICGAIPAKEIKGSTSQPYIELPKSPEAVADYVHTSEIEIMETTPNPVPDEPTTLAEIPIDLGLIVTKTPLSNKEKRRLWRRRLGLNNSDCPSHDDRPLSYPEKKLRWLERKVWRERLEIVEDIKGPPTKNALKLRKLQRQRLKNLEKLYERTCSQVIGKFSTQTPPAATHDGQTDYIANPLGQKTCGSKHRRVKTRRMYRERLQRNKIGGNDKNATVTSIGRKEPPLTAAERRKMCLERRRLRERLGIVEPKTLLRRKVAKRKMEFDNIKSQMHSLEAPHSVGNHPDNITATHQNVIKVEEDEPQLLTPVESQIELCRNSVICGVVPVKEIPTTFAEIPIDLGIIVSETPLSNKEKRRLWRKRLGLNNPDCLSHDDRPLSYPEKRLRWLERKVWRERLGIVEDIKAPPTKNALRLRKVRERQRLKKLENLYERTCSQVNGKFPSQTTPAATHDKQTDYLANPLGQETCNSEHDQVKRRQMYGERLRQNKIGGNDKNATATSIGRNERPLTAAERRKRLLERRRLKERFRIVEPKTLPSKKVSKRKMKFDNIKSQMLSEIATNRDPLEASHSMGHQENFEEDEPQLLTPDESQIELSRNSTMCGAVPVKEIMGSTSQSYIVSKLKPIDLPESPTVIADNFHSSPSEIELMETTASPLLTSSFKSALNALHLMRNDQDTTIPTDPSTQQNILNESDKSVPVTFPTGQSQMFNVDDSQRNSRPSMFTETDLVEELVEVSEIRRKSILNTTTVANVDALIEEGNLSRLEKRRLWRERQRQNTEGTENVTIEPSSNGKEPPLTNAERRKRFLERRRWKELLGIVEPKPQSSKRGASRRTRNPDLVEQFDNNKSLMLPERVSNHHPLEAPHSVGNHPDNIIATHQNVIKAEEDELQLRVSADSQTESSRDSMICGAIPAKEIRGSISQSSIELPKSPEVVADDVHSSTSVIELIETTSSPVPDEPTTLAELPIDLGLIVTETPLSNKEKRRLWRKRLGLTNPDCPLHDDRPLSYTEKRLRYLERTVWRERLGIVEDIKAPPTKNDQVETRRMYRERLRQNKIGGNDNATVTSIDKYKPPMTVAERRKMFLERRRLRELLRIVEPKTLPSKKGAKRKMKFDNIKFQMLSEIAPNMDPHEAPHSAGKHPDNNTATHQNAIKVEEDEPQLLPPDDSHINFSKDSMICGAVSVKEIRGSTSQPYIVPKVEPIEFHEFADDIHYSPSEIGLMETTPSPTPDQPTTFAEIPIDLGLIVTGTPLSNKEKRRLWRRRLGLNNPDCPSHDDRPLSYPEKKLRWLERKVWRERFGIVEEVKGPLTKNALKLRKVRERQRLKKLLNLYERTCSHVNNKFSTQTTPAPTHDEQTDYLANSLDCGIGQETCDSEHDPVKTRRMYRERLRQNKIGRNDNATVTSIGKNEPPLTAAVGPIISDALIEEGNLSRQEKRRLWRERQQPNTEGNENVTTEPSSNGKEPPLTNAERRKRFLERRRLKELLGIVEPKTQPSKRGATRTTKNPDAIAQIDNNKSLMERVSNHRPLEAPHSVGNHSDNIVATHQNAIKVEEDEPQLLPPDDSHIEFSKDSMICGAVPAREIMGSTSQSYIELPEIPEVIADDVHSSASEIELMETTSSPAPDKPNVPAEIPIDLGLNGNETSLSNKEKRRLWRRRLGLNNPGYPWHDDRPLSDPERRLRATERKMWRARLEIVENIQGPSTQSALKRQRLKKLEKLFERTRSQVIGKCSTQTTTAATHDEQIDYIEIPLDLGIGQETLISGHDPVEIRRLYRERLRQNNIGENDNNVTVTSVNTIEPALTANERRRRHRERLRLRALLGIGAPKRPLSAKSLNRKTRKLQNEIVVEQEKNGEFLGLSTEIVPDGDSLAGAHLLETDHDDAIITDPLTHQVVLKVEVEEPQMTSILTKNPRDVEIPADLGLGQSREATLSRQEVRRLWRLRVRQNNTKTHDNVGTNTSSSGEEPPLTNAEKCQRYLERQRLRTLLGLVQPRMPKSSKRQKSKQLQSMEKRTDNSQSLMLAEIVPNKNVQNDQNNADALTQQIVLKVELDEPQMTATQIFTELKAPGDSQVSSREPLEASLPHILPKIETLEFPSSLNSVGSNVDSSTPAIELMETTQRLALGHCEHDEIPLDLGLTASSKHLTDKEKRRLWRKRHGLNDAECPSNDDRTLTYPEKRLRFLERKEWKERLKIVNEKKGPPSERTLRLRRFYDRQRLKKLGMLNTPSWEVSKKSNKVASPMPYDARFEEATLQRRLRQLLGIEPPSKETSERKLHEQHQSVEKLDAVTKSDDIQSSMLSEIVPHKDSFEGPQCNDQDVIIPRPIVLKVEVAEPQLTDPIVYPPDSRVIPEPDSRLVDHDEPLHPVNIPVDLGLTVCGKPLSTEEKRRLWRTRLGLNDKECPSNDARPLTYPEKRLRWLERKVWRERLGIIKDIKAQPTKNALKLRKFRERQRLKKRITMNTASPKISSETSEHPEIPSDLGLGRASNVQLEEATLSRQEKRRLWRARQRQNAIEANVTTDTASGKKEPPLTNTEKTQRWQERNRLKKLMGIDVKMPYSKSAEYLREYRKKRQMKELEATKQAVLSQIAPNMRSNGLRPSTILHQENNVPAAPIVPKIVVNEMGILDPCRISDRETVYLEVVENVSSTLWCDDNESTWIPQIVPKLEPR